MAKTVYIIRFTNYVLPKVGLEDVIQATWLSFTPAFKTIFTNAVIMVMGKIYAKHLKIGTIKYCGKYSFKMIW